MVERRKSTVAFLALGLLGGAGILMGQAGQPGPPSGVDRPVQPRCCRWLDYGCCTYSIPCEPGDTCCECYQPDCGDRRLR